eukprot:scaffold155032_cov14-Tisochrysis_lutea.AAC.1
MAHLCRAATGYFSIPNSCSQAFVEATCCIEPAGHVASILYWALAPPTKQGGLFHLQSSSPSFQFFFLLRTSSRVGLLTSIPQIVTGASFSS